MFQPVEYAARYDGVRTIAECLECMDDQPGPGFSPEEIWAARITYLFNKRYPHLSMKLESYYDGDVLSGKAFSWVAFPTRDDLRRVCVSVERDLQANALSFDSSRAEIEEVCDLVVLTWEHAQATFDWDTGTTEIPITFTPWSEYQGGYASK